MALIEDVRTEPARNVVFAAPAGDPRTRRPADMVRLVVSILTVLVAAWAFDDGNGFDSHITGALAGDLPDWISAPLTIVYILGGLYAGLLLISILLFGDGRTAVARDMFLAGAVASAVAIAASLTVSSEWPDIIPELLERDGTPSYPVVRLALATAIIRVARPFLSLPMRHVGSRLLGSMVLASLLLGYGTPTAIVGGLAAGIGAAAAVHLIFGSGVGIPSLARISEALGSIGLDVARADYFDQHPLGTTMVHAELVSGEHIVVKVYGRDAVDAALVSRAWRNTWYRDGSRSLASTGIQHVEHESLMLLEAARGGALVPDLAGWGPGDSGDALLAVQAIDGTRLANLAAADIDDEMLASCWDALDALHRAGIVHRQIDQHALVLGPDGAVITQLAGAERSTDAAARVSDVAQLLVTTAVAVGPQRAVTAARARLGDEALVAALPFVQASALTSSLQHARRTADCSLDDLRGLVASETGTEPPPLAQIARVTWTKLAMTALTLFAAWALIAALSDIGFDTIADEVSNATWGWVAMAFILAQLTNVGEWISLTGLVPRVPLGPTLRFRYAISFISLAVPSDAGAISMNIRYMQKQGVPWTAAVAQGPLLTVFTKAFDIVLLIISARAIGETVDLDDIDSGSVLNLIVLVVVAVVVGAVVTLAVPALRRRVLPPIRDGLRSVSDTLRDPERVLRIAAGTLMQRILFAMTLAASAHAYGGSVGLGEAIFINSLVSLFIGLMPVPGGIGIGEAALAAGLGALGMPEAAALAAAVTHRMVTVYIPPLYGWYATRWLTRNDYL